MRNSPYARLNLTRNPFGELSLSERMDLAVVDTEHCLNWLKEPKSAVQIIGPCGHGKTTHLLALRGRLADSHYVYFPETGEQPPLPRQRPLLVDEAQRLVWWRRRQLLSCPGPVVIATHVDWTARFESAGFRLHTIDVGLALSTERLQHILNRRVIASWLRPPPDLARTEFYSSTTAQHPLCLTRQHTVTLQLRWGSNIRSMEHYLYDVFQHLVEKGQTWLPANF